MDESLGSRSEERASHRWLLRFRELNAVETREGLMIDVSAGGLAFLCSGDVRSLQVGNRLDLQFHIPRYDGPDEPEGAVGVARTGRICSRETMGSSQRIGVQFDTPLSLAPADEMRLIRLATWAQECATSGEPGKRLSISEKGG